MAKKKNKMSGTERKLRQSYHEGYQGRSPNEFPTRPGTPDKKTPPSKKKKN